MNGENAAPKRILFLIVGAMGLIGGLAIFLLNLHSQAPLVIKLVPLFVAAFFTFAGLFGYGMSGRQANCATTTEQR